QMIYDRLEREKQAPMSQLLISPCTVELSPEDCDVLLENLKLLADYGIQAEHFGGRSVIVRSVPADIDREDIPAVIDDLCQQLRTGASGSEEARRQKVLSTIACKAAIKAGKLSQPRELRVIAEAVLSGQVSFCPHGRPVSMELSKAQLDRNFKRM
ncbi:MAG: DNA mismatch repair protein MutL, partial [Oscillospiraceae bacterium]|nr:DNA mismatch repair protein MutL [Oscillospiraceae bacterium]